MVVCTKEHKMKIEIERDPLSERFGNLDPGDVFTFGEKLYLKAGTSSGEPLIGSAVEIGHNWESLFISSDAFVTKLEATLTVHGRTDRYSCI